MTGRNANIYFPEETYNKLRKVAGVKISRFVSEAVEEKIQKEQKKQREELRQKLIEGYKANNKNKKLQAELTIWDETVEDLLLDIDKKENE